MNATITYPNGTNRTMANFEELSLVLIEMQEEDPMVITKLKLDFSGDVLMADLEGYSIPDFEATPQTLLSISQLANSLCAAHEYRYWKYIDALPPHPQL